MNQRRSAELLERACAVIPGGVNSPVRAFRAVGGTPPFLARGAGAHVWDVDGNEYVDHVCSWGPLIFGHAPAAVLVAIGEAAASGTSFGAPTEREVLFAERLCRLVPSLEQVRLVSSGTEATMSAIRLARGFTNRPRIIKVAGGYHGHVDALLVRAGSGLTTFGVPDSAGVTEGTAQDTIVVPYNDVEAMRAAIDERVAAVIIEPVAGNMGVVPPAVGYLQSLRELTRAQGALLIFDEVISGLRLGLGGAQAYYRVTADLICLGKIIGGGLPLGAYGGRAEIMQRIAPQGPVYQAGTLSGNPLAVAAGLATLQLLESENPYPRLEERTQRLVAALGDAAREASVPTCTNRVGSMFTTFFCEAPVTDLQTALRADTQRYGRFHRRMLELGVYLAPAQFEAAFVSAVHTDGDLDRTATAARQALREI